MYVLLSFHCKTLYNIAHKLIIMIIIIAITMHIINNWFGTLSFVPEQDKTYGY